VCASRRRGPRSIGEHWRITKESTLFHHLTKLHDQVSPAKNGSIIEPAIPSVWSSAYGALPHLLR